MRNCGNIFDHLPAARLADEVINDILTAPQLRIERIVSTGQASPPDFWYDQEWKEWVVLLRGGARLLFEGEAEERSLRPGDYVHIPAHQRHRVVWTDPDQASVWLAVHYR